jgi:hypothetical protein
MSLFRSRLIATAVLTVTVCAWAQKESKRRGESDSHRGS